MSLFSIRDVPDMIFSNYSAGTETGYTLYPNSIYYLYCIIHNFDI